MTMTHPPATWSASVTEVSEDRCRELLAVAPVARSGLMSAAGPLLIPLSFRVSDGVRENVMITVPPSKTRDVDGGPSAWCWLRLQRSSRGSLRSITLDERVDAVSFVVCGGQILVRGHGPGFGNARGEEGVTLEAAGGGPGESAWLIRATGLATPAFGEPARAQIPSSVRVRGHHELDASPHADRRGVSPC